MVEWFYGELAEHWVAESAPLSAALHDLLYCCIQSVALRLTSVLTMASKKGQQQVCLAERGFAVSGESLGLTNAAGNGPGWFVPPSPPTLVLGSCPGAMADI